MDYIIFGLIFSGALVALNLFFIGLDGFVHSKKVTFRSRRWLVWSLVVPQALFILLGLESLVQSSYRINIFSISLSTAIGGAFLYLRYRLSLQGVIYGLPSDFQNNSIFQLVNSGELISQTSNTLQLRSGESYEIRQRSRLGNLILIPKNKYAAQKLKSVMQSIASKNLPSSRSKRRGFIFHLALSMISVTGCALLLLFWSASLILRPD